MRNPHLRFFIHGATAVGRAFGRDRPGLLDVLQVLADERTPAGAQLAHAGLSEQAIVCWRRRQYAEAPVPLLAVEEVRPTPDAEGLLEAVLGRATVLNLDVARAEVGAALLRLRDSDEPDLAALLDFYNIGRSRLARKLTRSVGRGAPSPGPGQRPGIAVYRQVDHLVFVPYAPSGEGLLRELKTLATHCALDVSIPELGERVLTCLRDYGRTEGPEAKPYWEELGHKTESAFLHRSRMVMASQLDFSVEFHATWHLGRLRFDVRSDITPTFALLDDTPAIGNALKTALQASKG